MDPELLKYLANMTPEQLMEAIRSGQLAGTSGIQPAPGTPAASASPWQPGVGLKVTEGQPIPMAAIREGAQFGDAATAVRPVPQALPGPIPAPGSPQFAAAQTLAPAGEAALLQNQPVMGAGPKIPPGMPSGVNFVRPEGLVRADGPAMRAPLPRAGAQPLPPPPSAPGVPMSDPSLSAVRPKPFGLGDLLEADRPGPVAAAGAPVRPAPMPAAPPAAPAPMPQVAGNRIMGVAEAQARFGVGFAEAARIANGEVPLPAGRAPMPGAPPAAVPGSMGSPIPTPGSVPGVPGTAPGVPPPATQAMPTPSAAAPAPTTGAAGGAAPAASRLSKVLGAVRPALGKLGIAGTAYGIASDAAGLIGQADAARDPSLSPIENFGRGALAAGSAMFAPPAQPTREEMLADPAGAMRRLQTDMMGGNTPIVRNFNPVAMAANAGSALADLGGKAINWAITRPGAERFQDAQPGTAATIRAAMDSGQSRGAPTFDIGNPQPADPGATPPAPAVRPATPGGGQRKRPAAPAIPPSPETGVSGGSPGAGPGSYKLLDQKLSVPMVENMQASPSPTAVRPGGPEGSWRDKGYTAMLNDKRGVVGEGWRTPLREGPGGGASFNRGIADRGLFSGKLSQAVPPDPSLNMGSAPSMPDAAGLAVRPSLPKSQVGENGIYAPIGGMDAELEEDEEDKRARLARSGPRQFSPRFLSPQ